MVPPDYFHMIKPASDPNFPWTGIFFGAPILGIWYWCTDQVIVQRVLSARDEGHAKAGTIFAGFLKILPVFMLVLPGIIAKALFRDRKSTRLNSSHGYISYAVFCLQKKKRTLRRPPAHLVELAQPVRLRLSQVRTPHRRAIHLDDAVADIHREAAMFAYHRLNSRAV